MTSGDELIPGIDITKSEIINTMEKHYQQKPEIINVRGQGAGEVGYMSVIYHIQLKWPKPEENFPNSLVLKVNISSKVTDAISTSDKEDKDKEKQGDFNKTQDLAHDNEVKHLQLFSQEPDAHFLYPEIYDAKDSSHPTSYILMRDYEGCKIVDLVEGFTETQLYKIVDQIVKIQHYAVLSDKWRELECPEEWRARSNNFIAMIKNVFAKFTKDYPEYFGKLEIINKNTFEKDAEWVIREQGLYKTGERFGTMMHGDLWAAQILWRDDENIEMIVDWQITRLGSPLRDLFRILTTCVSVEERRRLQKPLMDYYFVEFEKAVKSSGRDMPFTREELDEELKTHIQEVTVFTIITTAIWAGSDILKNPDGTPNKERQHEMFNRCKYLIDDTIEMNGW